MEVVFVFLIGWLVFLFIFSKIMKSKDDKEKNFFLEKKEKIAQEEYHDRCANLIDLHIDALYRNWRNKRTVDDYGIVRDDAWRKELIYFYEKVVLADKIAADSEKRMYDLFRCRGMVLENDYFFNQFSIRVEKMMQSLDEDRKSFDGALNEEIISGEDYEIYCADLLERNGWLVQRTPASGDQGVDLIAVTENIRVVVQCKFYSKPVGNAAVQEVIAGKLFYDGGYAVVVSNNLFTSSAKSLAQSSGVILMHHEQLCDLKGMLGCFEDQDSIEHAIEG